MPLPWGSGGVASSRGSQITTGRHGGGGSDASVVSAWEGGAAFGALHAEVDRAARPVLAALWAAAAADHDGRAGGRAGVSDEPPRAGCVISEPGAAAQPWHRDGPVTYALGLTRRWSTG